MSIFPVENKYMQTGNYLRISKIEEGEELRIRILAPGIVGWEDWTEDNKPVRYRAKEKPSRSIDEARPIKGFFACCVWNYDLEAVQILHLTQKRVKDQLQAIEEKKGSLVDYDIRIIKIGKDKNVTYTVLPSSPTEIPDVALDALEAAQIDLEALYEGADPFGAAHSTGRQIKPQFTDIHKLAKLLADGIPVLGDDAQYLVSYLEFAKTKVPKPIDEVVDTWLAKPNDFLKAYQKWLEGEKARHQNQRAVNN